MAALTEPVHRLHRVRVPEDVGALRRAVSALAEDVASLRRGEADLVATELATNLVRHTRVGGYVLYRTLRDGIELLSVDHGPGIGPGDLPPRTPRTGEDEPAAMPVRGLDGTDETPGETTDPPVATREEGLHIGLATVERYSSQFDCHTTSKGTVILARLGTPPPGATGRWRWGGVSVPLGDAAVSGDGWAVDADGRLAALVVDGLGHGPGAAPAAEAAISVFQQGGWEQPEDFMRVAHEAMRTTRGGVVGLCVIDQDDDDLTYLGVGNIASRVLVAGESHRLFGRDGVLGTELRPPRTNRVTGPWGPGGTLVMASNGVSAYWKVADYPGLFDHDPAVVAAVLHRDHSAQADDATVLVVRDTRFAT